MSNQPNPDREKAPATPRWVKVFAVVFVVIVLAVIALHLTGNNPGGLIPHMP
jgi:hypothetical protein